MADNPTFTLSLRLEANEEQIAILNKRFWIECHLYNLAAKEARKRLNKMYKDPEYKSIMTKYRKAKKKNSKAKLSTEQKKKLKALRDKYKLNGQYCLEPFVKNGRYKFKKHVDSDSCAKLTHRVWKAVQKNLFSRGESVHFKRYDCFRSIEGKDAAKCIKFENGHLKWNNLIVPARVKKKDSYAKECIATRRIKFCRIKRRWHKHQWRYYLELVFAGLPPMKKRKMGKGRVGIDIGPSTIAVVSEANVLLKELDDGIGQIDKEIKRLNRKADRQRRYNNPENYNDDGTIRRQSKSFHRKWNISNRNRKTYDKMRSLYQKRADKLEQFQNLLANEIVSMGDEIVIEHMNFQALQKRSKNTEVSEKTGRFKRKKRFGKSIQIHAPNQLVSKVRMRLGYRGEALIEVDTVKMKASQYNHMTGEYMSSDLSKRWKQLDDDINIQRDLYSAFLLFNAFDKETIDDELCYQTFDNFFDSHNRLIEELRKQKQEGKVFPSCMGI